MINTMQDECLHLFLLKQKLVARNSLKPKLQNGISLIERKTAKEEALSRGIEPRSPALEELELV